jgi:transcriptional regulator with XRE-family HTH domain
MTNHPLKLAREAKGLSQEQLARKVQVEVAAIQRPLTPLAPPARLENALPLDLSVIDWAN